MTTDADAKPRSTDDLVDSARDAPPAQRDALYMQAVSTALGEGNLDRARQIVSEHISNPAWRTELLENINRQQLASAVEQQRLDEALRLAGALRAPNERAGVYGQLAMQALEKGDKKTALRLLGEADAQIGRAKDIASFQGRLQIARIAARVDPARGFGILESAVDQVNGLLSAAATVEGFGCDHAFEDGELLLRQDGIMNGLVYQTAEALASLAEVDPERVRVAALRFERPEAQVVSLLRVAAALFGALPTQVTVEVDESDGGD
jgi:hypothetical protein